MHAQEQGLDAFRPIRPICALETIGDLADGLGVNPSNATRYCARLQRLGLVHRARSVEDGRMVQVGLTQEGQALVAAVTERRRQEIDAVLERMTGPDAVRVVAALPCVQSGRGEVEDRDRAASFW